MGKKLKKLSYSHSTKGDLVKIEIRDESYKVIYRTKFNMKDKNAMLNHLKVLEEYSGFSVAGIIRDNLKLNKWI